jgi:hypothetical protein
VQHDLFVTVHAPFNLFKQQLHSANSEFVTRNTTGRQGGGHQCRKWDVIKSYHRQIIRHPTSSRITSLQSTDGYEIIVTEQTGDLRMGIQQRVRCLASGLGHGRTGTDPAGLDNHIRIA